MWSRWPIYSSTTPPPLKPPHSTDKWTANVWASSITISHSVTICLKVCSPFNTVDAQLQYQCDEYGCSASVCSPGQSLKSKRERARIFINYSQVRGPGLLCSQLQISRLTFTSCFVIVERWRLVGSKYEINYNIINVMAVVTRSWYWYKVWDC